MIKDHLELKERNASLDPQMPIDRYKADDPFENHPLFKTEEQARLEETLDGEPAFVAAETIPWPGEAAVETTAAADVDDSESNGFWSVDRARDFDWGD
ncbi:MAG: hypothetical protein KGI93_02105 [Acidobacteriota bacterium]|nr:hypothetical protein [Acidobacteriota bacterium]